MTILKTRCGGTVDVCAEEVRRICGFFDFSPNAVEVPFAKKDVTQFLKFVEDTVIKEDAWQGLEDEEETMLWMTYLDLLAYFDIKQPFLDEALAQFLTTLKREPAWGGSAGIPGVLCEVWLDRLVEIGIRAQRDQTAFPKTWAAFYRQIVDAARVWSLDDASEFQELRYVNGNFEWLQLARHPRWSELATPDVMTAVSFALAAPAPKNDVRRRPETRGPVVAAVMDVAEKKMPLNDAFSLKVDVCSDEDEEERNINVTLVARRKNVGVVEVIGTMQLLSGSTPVTESVRLRCVYYPKDNMDARTSKFLEDQEIRNGFLELPSFDTVSLSSFHSLRLSVSLQFTHV